jgi:hypothetical protein
MNRPESHFETLRNRLGIATEESRILERLRGFEAILTNWCRGSRIVQWFLSEPDPEVIVIDLRETYTVGPVIRALEWSAVRTNHLAERTGLADAARRTTAWVESAPMRAAGWLVFACALGGLLASLVAGGTVAGWLVVAGLALLATREHRSASELAETRIGQALIASFQPPEPPEKRH